MFNLKNIKEVECKEKYRVEISNRFADLEELDTVMGINTLWKTIRKSKKILAKKVGYHELKRSM
jgi:hypothetical protein